MSQFTTFRYNSRAGLVMDRDSLHESEGYRRQVDALKQLRNRRTPMADTTLDQVRDEMRAWRSHTGFESGRLLGWADAIDAAIKQREQNKRDAARLDWMDAHPRLATIVIDGHPTECYFYGVSGAAGLKLREIIDVAMAKESGNG